MLCAGNRLQELEAEQQQIQEERELLSRQKEAMKAEAGPVEQSMYFLTLCETFLKSSRWPFFPFQSIIHLFYIEIEKL